MNRIECQSMSFGDRQMTKAQQATRDRERKDAGRPGASQFSAPKVSSPVTQACQVPVPLLAACSNGGLERYRVAVSHVTRYVPLKDIIVSEQILGHELV